MESNELAGLVRFFHLAGRLKQEKRQGWLERGVKDSESVAGHSFRLALMAVVFAERQGLDSCRAARMALVHDLPEAICGDVATRIREELQKIPNREKEEREEKAMQEILGMLEGAMRKEVEGLWKEFNGRKTGEAKLVYELDRLEAIFQAREYEEKGNFRVSLEEFYDYMEDRMENPELRKVFGMLMEEREKK